MTHSVPKLPPQLNNRIGTKKNSCKQINFSKCSFGLIPFLAPSLGFPFSTQKLTFNTFIVQCKHCHAKPQMLLNFCRNSRFLFDFNLSLKKTLHFYSLFTSNQNYQIAIELCHIFLKDILNPLHPTFLHAYNFNNQFMFNITTLL